MAFFGFTLAQVLLLLGGAAALTVALHMLRAHHRRTEVPFLPLWERVLSRREGSRLFARLTRMLSLLLSLLIMTLLALALGDPRPEQGARGVTHRVVLIDAGLAMQASDVPGGRLAAALRWANKLAEQAGPLTPTLLVRVDSAAVPLAPFSGDAGALQRALEGLQASDLTTDPATAYRFALAALHGRSAGEVIFIGSGALEPEPALASQLSARHIALHRIAIGASARNLAITALAARRYPLDRNRSELLIGLRNASDEPEPIELTLLGDGAPLDVRQLELQPRSTEQRIYDDLAFAGQRIEARVRALRDGHDVLEADSHAYAVLPPRKRMRVLCVTAGNRYLEAALLLDEYFTVDVAAPERAPALAGYDAVIFDRVDPPSSVPIPALYLATPHVPGFGVDGVIERPRFEELDDKHPVLRFASLRDVNVAQAMAVRPASGDRAIARSADGPLIVSGERQRVPFVALTFDVQRSDLPLRVAWPLLLVNTLDWFANERRELAPSYVLGETARVALAPEHDASPLAGTVSVKPPQGAAFLAPVAEGQALLAPVRAGFYELSTAGGAQVAAVGFDPSTPLDLTLGKSSAAIAGLDRARMPDVWALLIAAALLLIAFEWIAFHRRWTP